MYTALLRVNALVGNDAFCFHLFPFHYAHSFSYSYSFSPLKMFPFPSFEISSVYLLLSSYIMVLLCIVKRFGLDRISIDPLFGNHQNGMMDRRAGSMALHAWSSPFENSGDTCQKKAFTQASQQWRDCIILPGPNWALDRISTSKVQRARRIEGMSLINLALASSI